jgi:Pyruvate/2-oxoacid:ferredoxin oxidoreductase gamma subunit
MLGAFTRITGLVSTEAMEKTIRENVSKKTIEANIKAFQKGLALNH